MYSTSTNYKNKILTDSTRQLLNIYIDNNKIEGRYVLGCSILYTLLNNDEFCFGSTPAKTVNLKIHKNALPDTYTRFYIESGIAGETVPIGYFNVDEISKDDDYTVSLTLIDDMSLFEFNYDGSLLSYPATLLTVLQDICSKAGVELGSTSFLNSNKQIAVHDNTVTARTYLGYIAEQAGGFAVIGRDGKLYIKTIGEDTAELNLRYFSEYSWGEKFKVSRVAYEDGVQDFKKGNETSNTVWINSDNMYIVDQEQIDNIYNEYQNFEVYSFSGTSIVDPAWDIGDILIIDDKKIVYQGELEYKGKFKASISSDIRAKTKEETTATKISNDTKIRRVQSQINQVEGTITQLVQETSEHEEKLTQVEQSVEEISQQVSEIADFTRTIQENNQIHLNETVAGEGYVLDFSIQGSTANFIYLAPKDGLTPSDTLVPLGGYFTLVSDKQNRTNMSEEAQITRAVLDEPLRNLNDVYDEFKIVNGIATVIRRIGVNSDLTLYVLEEEVVEELGELQLKTFDTDTYIYVQEYYNLVYSAKYIIKNDYSENFVTNYEANSMINQASNRIEETVSENFATKDELIEESSQRIQTAQEITQEVSKKVGEDEIISSINQSAEQIQIQADKISLSGKSLNLADNMEIVSNNFNVNSAGDMTCNNARVTGGKLRLEGGSEQDPDFIVGTDYSNGSIILPHAIYTRAGANERIDLNVYENGGADFEVYSDSMGCSIQFNLMNAGGDAHFRVDDAWFRNKVHAISYEYDSEEEIKKDIKKYEESAINIINKTDVYEFNYKNVKRAKKTIGFIIGNNYNTASEIINDENNGINSYSVVGILWKAIQEQQEMIEQLQDKIIKLEEK